MEVDTMDLDYGGGPAVSAQAATSPAVATGRAASHDERTPRPIAVKQATVASKILDELLDDMLSIVEQESSEEEEEADESGSTHSGYDGSSSVSSSNSNDNEARSPSLANKNGLKIPDNVQQEQEKSDMEEGELESEHELEERRIKQANETRLKAERLARQEERRKRRVENNISELDIYTYLRRRGFSSDLLSAFSTECVSRTRSTGQPASEIIPSTATAEASSPVNKLSKLSKKHSLNKLLKQADQAKESKKAVHRLLDTCTTIVAEQQQQQVQADEEKHFAEAAARKAAEIIRPSRVDRATSPLAAVESIQSRKVFIDKAVETLSEAQLTLAKANEMPTQDKSLPSTSNNRMPTPTSPSSPPSAIATAGGAAAQALPTFNRERAERAAQLAAKFQQALNSKHLVFSKDEVEKLRMPRAPLRPTAVTTTQLPPGLRAPLHPALNGLDGASPVAASSTLSTHRIANGAPAPRTLASTSSFVPNSYQAVSARPASTGSINAAVASTSTSLVQQQGAANVIAASSSSSATPVPRGDSIYDMVPDYLLKKPRTSMSIARRPLSPLQGEEGDMAVDAVDSAPTSATPGSRDNASTSDKPISIGLPARSSAGDKGKGRNPSLNVDAAASLSSWFGSAEPPQDGGMYSLIEMNHDDAPLPPVGVSEYAAFAPARASGPYHRTSMSPPPPPAQPATTLIHARHRTSMSPPPGAGGHNHSLGRGVSPPPPVSDQTLHPSLPQKPQAQAIARPKSTADTLKNMFPKSKPSGLPRKPTPAYNDILKSAEAVAIPHKAVKGIDPRRLAAMANSKAREESQRKEKETETSATNTDGPDVTMDVDQSENNPTSHTAMISSVLLEGWKDPTESSASPPPRSEAQISKTSNEAMTTTTARSASPARGMSQSPKAPSSLLQPRQTLDENVPLPSFRKSGQTSHNASPAVAKVGTTAASVAASKIAEGKAREDELENELSTLKRQRDVGSDSSPNVSNKRLNRSDAMQASDTERTSQGTKASSPPLAGKTANKATTSTNSSTPTSTRKLVNSQGKRFSDVNRSHDVNDDEDEPGSVQVAASRSSAAVSVPAPARRMTPVVEIPAPRSRQSSVASSVRSLTGSQKDKAPETSKKAVASPVRNAVKSAVARKSTGGFRAKTSSSAAASEPARSTSSTNPGLKVKLKLGGSNSSQSAAAGPASTTSSSSRTLKQPIKAKPGEIIDLVSSDEDDDDDSEDDVPIRKASYAAPSESQPQTSVIGTPPSSANRPRPKARPLAGSGKRLSEIGALSSDSDEEGKIRDASYVVRKTKLASSSTNQTETDTPATRRESPVMREASAEPSRPPLVPETSNTWSTGVAEPQSPKPTSPTRSLAAADSPPMQGRESFSPPFQSNNEDVVPDNASEAYSPSQMPRFSSSPEPSIDALQLPASTVEENTRGSVSLEDSRQIVDPAIPVATTAGTAIVSSQITRIRTEEDSPRMTQVASSQSPETQPLGNSASEIGDSFDDDVDMLADEEDAQGLANDLLGETLADLPDIPTSILEDARTGDRATSLQKEDMVSTVQRQIVNAVESPSSQKTYRDPMDLSNFFGSEEEDAEGESEDEAKADDTLERNAQEQVTDTQPEHPARQLQPLRSPQNQQQQEKVSKTVASATIPKSTSQEIPTQPAQVAPPTPTILPKVIASFLDELRNAQEGRPPSVPSESASTAVTDGLRQVRDLRAIASDWMATQSVETPTLPTCLAELQDLRNRTPVISAANLLVPSSSTSTLQSQYGTSPAVAPSEGESVEIIMGEQSPLKFPVRPSTTAANEGISSAKANTAHRDSSDASLHALDRPLEDAVPTKCKYRTGCLNMDCIYSHACPKLPASQAKYYDLPKTIRDCPDGILCDQPMCPFSHPSPAARRAEPCPNQAQCPFGAKCVFKHVDLQHSQLAKRSYQSHNASARFNQAAAPQPANMMPAAPTASISPADRFQYQTSPPPVMVPAQTTMHKHSNVTSTTLPFLSYHPMPPMPSASRSASPAVPTPSAGDDGISKFAAALVPPRLTPSVTQTIPSRPRDSTSPQPPYVQQQQQQPSPPATTKQPPPTLPSQAQPAPMYIPQSGLAGDLPPSSRQYIQQQASSAAGWFKNFTGLNR